MLERDAQRFKAIQVGMLMRAYRESFPTREGGRGLTQEELLRRMASVDSDYTQRYSHTTVSRWESGATRPSRERLEVFGKALNLSAVEVDGLFTLAGFGPDAGTAQPYRDLNDDDEGLAAVAPARVETAFDYSQEPIVPACMGGSQSISSLVRHALFCFVLPALVIVGGAYLLAVVGWNETWMSMAYIVGVIILRLSAGYMALQSPYDLCEFLSSSLFFLLTTPLLQSAALHVDHYGFYALMGFDGAPTHYMLALLVNLVLATIAGGTFYVLWRWRYSPRRAELNTLRRAGAVVIPPVALVWVVTAVITNVGIFIQFVPLFAVLAAACMIMLMLRDPDGALDHEDRRFLLWSTLLVAIVLSVFAAGVMIAVYASPGLPTIWPDHNLLFTWDIDYAALGYPQAEAPERYKIGYLWHAMSLIVYMLFVVGGTLLATIYRFDAGGPPRSVGAPPSSSPPSSSPPSLENGPPPGSRVNSMARLGLLKRLVNSIAGSQV